MPAIDFGALLEQERAKARQARQTQTGAAAADADGGDAGATPPSSTTKTKTKEEADAILAATLSKLAAAGVIGSVDGEGEGAEVFAATPGSATGSTAEQQQEPVDYMTLAAARAVEEAKATKRLMQATLPKGMLAPWLGAEAGAVLASGEALYALSGPPAGVFYVPDFVTPELESAILGIAGAVPEGHPKWVRVRGRRLQCYGGEPTDDFQPQQLPAWVAQLCEGLVACGAFTREGKPDHVLLNEYRPGDGIMAHTDGPFYHPRAAILSLGGPAVFHFRRRPQLSGEPNNGSATIGSLVLQPRSLLVFTGEAYADCLHEILPAEEEVVGMVAESEDELEEEGEDGGVRRVTRLREGAPVLNLATAGGVKVGDVIRRAPVRVSLTFRRVKGKGGGRE